MRGILMKSIMVGIGIFVFGFILVSLCAGIFSGGNVEYSHCHAIVF
jgi:hypothetical protein